MDLWSVLSRVRPVAVPVGLVLCVLGVAVLGGTAYLHLGGGPERVETTRQAETVTATTEYRTAATVVGNTSLYEPGTRLVNTSGYVVGATPQVTFRTETGFDTTVSGVDGRLWLEHRASTEGGEPFWTDRQLLDRNRTTTGTVVTTVGTLNATAIALRQQVVRSETAGRGTVSTTLVSRTYFDDPVTGERRERTRRFDLSIPGGAMLSVSPVDGDGPSRTYTDPRTVLVERPAPVPWSRYGGGGVLFALGLVVVAIGRRDRVFGRSIERTESGEWERTLGEYSEWISRGSLVHHESEEAVPVEGIPELVKVAMNNRGGLVHCRTTDIVAYIDGTVTYYCRGPDSNWDPQNTLRSAFSVADAGPPNGGVDRSAAPGGANAGEEFPFDLHEGRE